MQSYFVLPGQLGNLRQMVDLGISVLVDDLPDGQGVVRPEKTVSLFCDVDAHLTSDLLDDCILGT